MMIGVTHRSNPTVQVPPWAISDDPMDNILTPFSVNRHFNAVGPPGEKCSFLDVITALQRYFPSNKNELVGSPEIEDRDIPLDAFSCDHFRIYEFKVRRCARARSHDWTECPYAHPGEKARRRDPRKFHYSGTACPDFKKGQCVRGDACEYAHGVFECWLHPARYRTQPCKDGTMCRRKVCFFAHTPDQLRVLPPRHGGILTEPNDGSPSRLGIDSFIRKSSFGSSPTSILHSPPNESPPFSPCESMGSNSLSELSGSVRGLQIGEASRMSMCPAASAVQIGSSFGSPRHCSMVRPELCSLLITPTRKITRSGLGVFDEEPSIERVESGRDLRAKIYAKLSKENSLAGIDSSESGADIGWVSELLKGSC